ncbi:GNAT family N-acetyltransferase [Paenibacillus rigui]|uniref:GNAT family N-acetyltransferase n=1 Tax=Paenibacillus rigui TaxID=554312 RepID=A0A229UWD1_9BACL|nr:GNAT family N-acetyltransferase [Paenibacillus rigui]OXM87734.1 GNAT family N-acetyltransferase [Paenibacillus rigui]
MKITTERLLLREYTEADLPVALSMFTSEMTMRFWPKPFDEDQVKGWIERNLHHYREWGFGRWVVTLKDCGRMIGDCGIVKAVINGKTENDLGYIIDHAYWEQGYGYEAAKACLEYGFEVAKLDRLVANMAYDHTASRRVAEKLGMTLETEFNNARNRDFKTYLYAIHRDNRRV